MTQKTVLVTGGSRGIGRSVAALLERRGYRVAVADLDRPGAGAAAFFRCDVSSETSVRACVRGVLHRFGRLDALINNAGLADPADPPVEKLALAAWNRRIGVNLTGVFLMTKHCVPHLRRSAGAIVNIASTRALQSEPNTEAYAATKGGVVALTHALAMSLGPRIRVNCMHF
jgi:NAD(P)-dependent dehydrogenase (short-subunit alcohol dehydrogenase family)